MLWKGAKWYCQLNVIACSYNLKARLLELGTLKNKWPF
jgi:hypothetical protein